MGMNTIKCPACGELFRVIGHKHYIKNLDFIEGTCPRCSRRWIVSFEFREVGGPGSRVVPVENKSEKRA